jgi:hypothetical protein
LFAQVSATRRVDRIDHRGDRLGNFFRKVDGGGEHISSPTRLTRINAPATAFAMSSSMPRGWPIASFPDVPVRRFKLRSWETRRAHQRLRAKEVEHDALALLVRDSDGHRITDAARRVHEADAARARTGGRR